MIDWPIVVLGALFVLGAGWLLLVGPMVHRWEQRMPKWMVRTFLARAVRLSLLATRIVAALVAGFGVALIVAASLR